MYKPTKKEIEELKAKHGEVFKLVSGDKMCLVKRPDRKTLSYASQVGAKNNVKFNETVLEDVFLVGDEEIKTVDSYFLGAGKQIQHLIDIKESSLEKL